MPVSFARVAVYSRSAENRAQFAAEMSARLGVEVVAADTPQAAVAGADLVGVAVASGTRVVLEAAWLSDGVHVCGISSVRPEAREIDDALWHRAAAIGVDDRHHVFESGDGRSALASGIRPEATAELWELASGRRPGRQRDADVTLLKTVGTGLQDLALAHAIYQRARERGLGQDLGDFPHIR